MPKRKKAAAEKALPPELPEVDDDDALFREFLERQEHWSLVDRFAEPMPPDEVRMLANIRKWIDADAAHIRSGDATDDASQGLAEVLKALSYAIEDGHAATAIMLAFDWGRRMTFDRKADELRLGEIEKQKIEILQAGNRSQREDSESRLRDAMRAIKKRGEKYNGTTELVKLLAAEAGLGERTVWRIYEAKKKEASTVSR